MCIARQRLVFFLSIDQPKFMRLMLDDMDRRWLVSGYWRDPIRTRPHSRDCTLQVLCSLLDAVKVLGSSTIGLVAFPDMRAVHVRIM